MNKSFSVACGLALAVALSTGGVLLKHPLPQGLAPGAYNDILIVENETQRPAGEKSAVPTDIPSQKMTGTQAVPTERPQAGVESEKMQGDINKGNPPSTAPRAIPQ
jgi:hypothetical protein